MEWLRQADVGDHQFLVGTGLARGSSCTVTSETAEHYDIKVAFHIEPYNGRTAESLVSDIQYLYQRYGDSLRSSAPPKQVAIVPVICQKECFSYGA